MRGLGQVVRRDLGAISLVDVVGMEKRVRMTVWSHCTGVGVGGTEALETEGSG